MASTVQNNAGVPYISRRSAVYGTHYMVSSTQPLASQAGVQILERGGNAADAAVAVAAAISLAEPFSTGIGGDCFCLFYSAKAKAISGLNGSGRAPAALTIERLKSEFGISGDEIPARSVHAVTVPGAAAGWVDTVERFGSGKVSLADILGPAIALAEEGVPVGELTSPFWKDGAELLKSASPNGGELLIDGEGPNVGQIFRSPTLANTLRLLAQHGKKGFYEGPVADAIVGATREQGGLMTHDDLKSHATAMDEPISYEYHGYRLHECAPNGSGLAALIAMGILDVLEEQSAIPKLSDVEHNSTEYLHIIIEVLRIAFADARYYVCDPDFRDTPVQALLSKEYLAKRAALFDPTRAAADIKHGSPLGGSDTVYFTVVDSEGNACSFINSLYHGFGSGIVPKGCGFALHDRGSLFRLDPGHPNCLEPGKRPYHTIIPAMVTVQSELFMSYGIMGGYNQPQAHVQVLLNMIRFGMNPQAALDVPRICIQVDEGRIAIEEGISDSTVQQLRELGHNVYLETGLQRATFGRGQVIKRETDQRTGVRVLVAGSDPRSDGQATGR
ncbi:gamma-glutamyltranspeptidase [Martensiomyces pterosporus]|nr:gamma-glutamyltranspeptidase [Martensiomyces pterosporus]